MPYTSEVPGKSSNVAIEEKRDQAIHDASPDAERWSRRGTGSSPVSTPNEQTFDSTVEDLVRNFGHGPWDNFGQS